jgi:hypothetical protein
MVRIGITGHQGLEPATERLIAAAIERELSGRGPVVGISSLAEGADQIFASAVLGGGGSLIAVIPSEGYEETFEDEPAKSRYREFRDQAAGVVTLPFSRPGEAAFFAAGRRVAEMADELIAVWDGTPARGLGGTADVVAHAHAEGVPVSVVWPPGSARLPT